MKLTTHHIRFISLFCATLALYSVMVFGTLRHLQEITGLVPFDLRPFGYAPDDARLLIAALGEAGRDYYVGRQLPLDAVYPAFMALTLVCICRWGRARGVSRRFCSVGCWLAAGAATLDYLENLFVAHMLLRAPDLSVLGVRLASGATIAKSGATSAAILLALSVALAVLAFRVAPCVRRWNSEKFAA